MTGRHPLAPPFHQIHLVPNARPRVIPPDVLATDGLGEMTLVAPRLWQGSRPACTDLRGEFGIDVLVLAAEEHHPPPSCFPNVSVFYAALDDSGPPPTREELRQANVVADVVAQRYVRGDRVLITCYAGLNRSGLITALVLRRAHGLTGREAIAAVQAARPSALGNAHFRAYLEAMTDRNPWAWSAEAFKQRPELLARIREFGEASRRVALLTGADCAPRVLFSPKDRA